MFSIIQTDGEGNGYVTAHMFTKIMMFLQDAMTSTYRQLEEGGIN